MDGSTGDHSDSDSGESWTLLEPGPAYGEDAPELCSASTHERDTTETNIEKDEDTDGISIISDSEPESATYEAICDMCLSEENLPKEEHKPPYISADSFVPDNDKDNTSVRSEDDLLGDNNAKHKTYVHRRNKRLSTVLNIIMLGSVITAAGVAIGHMWGAKNECPMHTTPSVNKILSNLYKLQEENAYLRNKLKELSIAGHIPLTQQHKLGSERSPLKQPKYKKIYEGPLNSKRADMIEKFVDNESNKPENPTIQTKHKKDFNDINRLIEMFNKTMRHDQIIKQIRQAEIINKNKDPANVNEITKNPYEFNLKRRIESEINIEKLSNMEPLLSKHNKIPEKKITYADSLKTDHQHKKFEKPDTDDIPRFKEHVNKKLNKEDNNMLYPNSYSEDSLKNDNQKNKKFEKADIEDLMIQMAKFKEHANKKQNTDNNILYQNAYSEEDFKKDNRYMEPKYKQERKKRDRQKMHKKQKRNNKYEQWEMKGGYMKDYDDFSVSSSQENDYPSTKPDKDIERINYMFLEKELDNPSVNIKNVDQNLKSDENTLKFINVYPKDKRNVNLNWYDKRAAVRSDARKKLEYELFGHTTPNTAGWYFRRMHKREQCRAQGDNSTYRKGSKRKTNFKIKH